MQHVDKQKDTPAFAVMSFLPVELSRMPAFLKDGHSPRFFTIDRHYPAVQREAIATPYRRQGEAFVNLLGRPVVDGRVIVLLIVRG